MKEMKSFDIKTEEELASYGSSRGSNAILSVSQWGKLFNGTIAAIGYPRVVTDEVKGYDNRITPPKDQIDRATSIGKKITIQASECKKYFTIKLVDVAA